LSFAQQRLWFLDQLIPGTAAYNVPAGARITGTIDITVVRQSLDEIVRRHEVLRTTFVSLDGRARQVIAPAASVDLSVVELSHVPVAERETTAGRLVSEAARKPFKLDTGPLFRATLFRLSDRDHILLLTMHHIISDGWSMSVLLLELNVLYQAYSSGKPSPLPELPIQYADFAVWQREKLRDKALDDQLDYSTRQLGGPLPRVELATDYQRPAIQSSKGARQPFALDKKLITGLKSLSQEAGVTLFMTLLAGFKVLLNRYTGQYDVIVGSPVAGRNHAATEGLIGFFANTLVLRTDLSGDPTFRELLGRLHKSALGAYANQDVPFEKIVDTLQLERDLSHNPIFQILFSFTSARMSQIKQA